MSRRALVIGVVVAAVIAGCGGDDDEQAKTSTAPTTTQEPTAKPAGDETSRTLEAGELKGFRPVDDGVSTEDPREWLSITQDSTIEPSAYNKRGFVAGLQRELESIGQTDVPGLNTVVQFKTAAQAKAEMARYVKPVSSDTGITGFPVPDLPGAMGFTAHGATVGDNVVFSKGAYFYTIARVRPTGVSAEESRGTVVAAAKSLHDRVPD